MECWAEKYCKQFSKDGCGIFCNGYVVLEILYKQSNIPKKYQYPQTLVMDPEDKDVFDYISNIMSGDIIAWVKSGKSLLMWGDKKGNGKTSLACAIANRYIRAMAPVTTLEPVVHFIKSAKFLEEVRQQFNNPTPEFPTRMKLIETVSLLIIDDIGAEKPTDWVRERLLNIIDERYSNDLSTIYTSNCNLSELNENLHGRIADRIKDAKSLNFKGASKRGQNR
jgi:DNA replication protein DnaC